MNNKELFSNICIDEDTAYTVFKFTIIQVLNLGININNYQFKNNNYLDDANEVGGGFDYLTSKFIENLGVEVSKNLEKKIKNSTDKPIIKYFISENIDIENRNLTLNYFNTYINNDKKLFKLFYNVCMGVMNEFVDKDLVKMKKGKYLIMNNDALTQKNTLLYRMNLPKLSDICYNSDSDIIRGKNFKQGEIKLTELHYKCLSYLANVKYKINHSLLKYILNLDKDDFCKLTGYTHVNEKKLNELKIKKKTLEKEYYNLKNKNCKNEGIMDELIKNKDKLISEINSMHSQLSLNYNICSTLLFAITYLDTPFSFYMFFDGRGRIYYENTLISPQGNKLGKVLLKFNNPQVIANTKLFLNFGYDYFKGRKSEENNKIKILNDDKVNELARKVDFTLDLWKESKSPLEYLSWYLCYINLKNNIDDTGYILKYDATCSGTQHISMIMQDKGLAESVNVLNYSDFGNDFYSDFAQYVAGFISRKKKSSSNLETLKSIKPTRDIVKKTVMSYAYNATNISM